MTLSLLRFDPNSHAATRWFAAEALAPRSGEDDGYAWHALMAAAFGDAAPKPFRVADRRGRPPQILAYTTRDPAALSAAAHGFADPLALLALGLAHAPVAAKAMPPFAPGRRLGISLKVRPTVRTDRDGDRRKSAEVDAFVAALRNAESAGSPPPDRGTAYCAWTSGRLEAGGMRVLDLRLDGLDRVPVARRDSRRGIRLVEGHAASFAGMIEVTDAETFAATLGRGIGRHRAFGYGMLLLSPP